MKTKPAILAVILATAALPLRAGDTPVPTTDLRPTPTVANDPVRAVESVPGSVQIQMKILQIELDVALKQYEKIATALGEAKSENELIDTHDIGDAQLKEKKRRGEEKLERLLQLADRLRQEIMRASDRLEMLRKKYGVSADPSLLEPKR